MTVEMSNRHWVNFRHPRSEYEFRARLVQSGEEVKFEIQKRDTALGEMGPWESVADYSYLMR